MLTRNVFDNSVESIRDVYDRYGNKLSLTVSHGRDGWDVSICTYEFPEDNIPDWGFYSGKHSSLPEAYSSIKSNVSYKRYPAIDLLQQHGG